MNSTTIERARTTPTRRIVGVVVTVMATALLGSPGASAHDSDTDGHVPPNVNYGFEVIGRDTLAGITDGLYTDVWSHDGYAYIGTFQEPDCSDAGVFVVDIARAIANYEDGDISGATVAEIRSAPNTRINDVKVHTVGNRDVLITTQEPCGSRIPGWAPSGGNAPFQVGQGGISLYDVSDPERPRSLKRNYLEYQGVHNTFAWTDDNGSYLIGVADTFDFLDTFIVDISRPHSPRLLTQTGVLDWLDDGFSLAQLETGTFGSINLHDVWVQEIDGVNQAVLSYWDAGFITLDVSDPANPVFLGDSDYPELDPPFRAAAGEPLPAEGLPYEGNAHAAVFSGDGDYIFAGDEDFDPTQFGVDVDGVVYSASGAAFGPPASTLAGTLVDAGATTACTTADIPSGGDPGEVLIVDRGDCFFQDKVDAAEANGFGGVVVVNNVSPGTITMGARDDQPVGIPSVMVSLEDGAALRDAAGSTITATELFNGWGFFRVLNNTDEVLTVPSMGMANPEATMDVGFLGQLGYYAPAETVESSFYDPDEPIGDLSMHNVEIDPSTVDVEPTFDAGPRMFVSWYSLGMRAIEYRPGHYHTNANGEGSYSQNVHEVGRFIADDGSNYWGVHVDEVDGEQVILASDRNTGLWVFTFDCTDADSVFYCQRDVGSEG